MNQPNHTFGLPDGHLQTFQPINQLSGSSSMDNLLSANTPFQIRHQYGASPLKLEYPGSLMLSERSLQTARKLERLIGLSQNAPAANTVLIANNQKAMKHSQNLLESLKTNRISRIEYTHKQNSQEAYNNIAKKSKLLFNQGCQTTIDTQTFINLLQLDYPEKVQKSSTAIQC